MPDAKANLPPHELFQARVNAAAEWLMSDDTAYDHNREGAIRAATAMLTIGDRMLSEWVRHLRHALSDLSAADRLQLNDPALNSSQRTS